MTDTTQRLNKLLALSLGISRREADDLIAAGDVRINDAVASLGARVNADDEVTVKHRPISRTTEFVYLALNKPVGYLCSRASQGGVPTIYQLLPERYHTLKTVGRLDKDSSGLILLTNDGDFAYQMTHPKFHKVKIYEARLDTPLEPLHQQMISDYGVALEDGISKFMIEKLPAKYEPKGELQGEGQDDEFTSASQRRGEPLLITMSEGRNRQIRRTFASLGYTVTTLHRTDFGNYALGDIPEGGYKILDIR